MKLSEETIGHVMSVGTKVVEAYREIQGILTELNLEQKAERERAERDAEDWKKEQSELRQLSFRSRRVMTLYDLEDVAGYHYGVAPVPTPTPASYPESEYVTILKGVPHLLTIWTIPEAEWKPFIASRERMHSGGVGILQSARRVSERAENAADAASGHGELETLASAFNRLSPVVQWMACSANNLLPELFPNGWREIDLDELALLLAQSLNTARLQVCDPIGMRQYSDVLRQLQRVVALATVVGDVVAMKLALVEEKTQKANTGEGPSSAG